MPINVRNSSYKSSFKYDSSNAHSNKPLILKMLH